MIALHRGFYILKIEGEVTMQVRTSIGSYSIKIEDDFEGLLSSINELNKTYSKIVIISDENVADIYKNKILEVLEGIGIEIFFIAFLSGEKNKNIDTVSSIYEKLIEYKTDRNSLILALGGGVVGDIAGFVAATYMRGIDYIQVPTSLIAQVDSSIGGKTGFNHSNKKNVVGSFYPPVLVYINVSALMTLDKRHFINGMAEVIKHAVIYDRKYLEYLKDNCSEIKNMEVNALKKAIRWSCEIKSDIVSKDEKDKGIRKVLNFGHSVGHAIESLLNYDLLHGECVSLGMTFASRLSFDLDGISQSDYEDIIGILKIYGLPVKVDKLDSSLIFKELYYDKKSSFDKIGIVCLEGLGEPCFRNDLDKNVILKALDSVINGD